MEEKKDHFEKVQFTRLKTVKWDNRELTERDFFTKLCIKAKADPDRYYVIYNEKDNTYHMRLNDLDYDVLYNNIPLGKDSENSELVKKLDEYVKYYQNHLLRKEQDEEYRAVSSSAIEDGKKGIFKSDEAKAYYIEYLKEEIARLKGKLNDPLLSSDDSTSKLTILHRKLEYTVIGRIIEGLRVLLYGTIIVLIGIPIAAGASRLLLIPLFIACIPAAFSFTYLLADEHGLSPIYLLGCLIKAVINNISDKKNIKLKMKDYEKRITSLIKSMSNSNLFVKSEILDDVKISNENSNQKIYDEILSLSYELRDKVKSINNKHRKTIYGEELTDIIDNILGDKTFSKYLSYTDRLKRLTYQVNKELEIERKNEEKNNEVDNLVEECNKVISKTL